jgi:ribosomal protein L31E
MANIKEIINPFKTKLREGAKLLQKQMSCNFIKSFFSKTMKVDEEIIRIGKHLNEQVGCMIKNHMER